MTMLALAAGSTPAKVDARCLSDVEVAKLIRAELKAAFPAVKFSVRSKHSVNIRYTDGPTPDRVEAIVAKFEGKNFDGMTDSTIYKPPFFYAGEWVYTYCFIFVARDLSAPFTARIAAAVAAYYGISVPAMVEGWVRPTREQESECQGATWTEWGTIIYRASRDRSSVCREHREAEYAAGLRLVKAYG